MELLPDHTTIGKSSASFCSGLPHETLMAYIKGHMDLPNLGEGLDINFNDITDHQTTINRKDACLFVARLALVTGRDYSRNCGGECEYASYVAVKLRGSGLQVHTS